MSALSFFGLGVQYNDDWAGRYYLQESLLLTVAAMPSVAYQVNDWLSLGGSVGLVYGRLRQKAAINNVLDGRRDGTLRGKSDTVTYAGSVGILLEPRKGTRLGVVYYSEVELDFSDAISTAGVGPTLRQALAAKGLLGAEVDLGMTIPQQVVIGGYHQLTDKLAIMADVNWQNWKEFGHVNVTIVSDTTTSLTTPSKLKDTWHVAVGAQYRIKPTVLLTAGFAYDSSAVSNANRTITQPFDRQYRYGGGALFELREDLTLGLSYEFLDAGGAPVDQFSGPLAGRITGSFGSNQIHFFNANLIWRH